MEKEYVVIVKKGIDLEAFDAELAASTGEGPIPNRAVDVANPRFGSRRMTHWMLTDQEANDLKADPRVYAVEIPPDQRDDIQIGLHATQSGSFYRGFNNNTDVNWGLRRMIEETNTWNGGNTITGDYQYALTGEGVDLVIQDSGIEPDHPEWQDSQGSSRFVELDWYTASGLAGTQSVNHYRDLDGHGTHCAGIAAGKTYGWAKGAAIYSQKLGGLEGSGDSGTGITISDAFDTIRLWHTKKNDLQDAAYTGRPTVVNMSWGYSAYRFNQIASGTYRGTPWTYSTESDSDLVTNYGIGERLFISGGNVFRIFPGNNASTDVEVEELIDAGVIVCIAAGNHCHKSDIVGGLDYDNFCVTDGFTYYYHRPSSPYDERAFFVGNLNSSQYFNLGVYLDRTATSSARGPAVNIWAPGSNIMSSAPTTYDPGSYTVYDYPANTNYKIMSIGGTSMASPQVAGLCALHLEADPNLTVEQIQQKLLNDSKAVIQDTGSSTDYGNYSTSLVGSTNRHAFSRYGRQPLNLTTNSNIILTKP